MTPSSLHYVLVTCYLTLGCVPAEPDTFRVSGFSQAQVGMIQDAMNTWCEASNETACLSIGEGDSEILPADPAKLCPGDIGICVHRSGGASDIWILPTLSSEDFYKTVLHELGHHLGCMSHIDNGNTMSPSVEAQPGFLTLEDLKCAGIN